MKTKGKNKIVLLIIICFTFFTSSIISKILLCNEGSGMILQEKNYSNILKTSNNDTSSPVIKFVKPDINNTTIRQKFYDFIVNITDDNPPLPGNVSIEISNATSIVFNASMIYSEIDQWIFTWDNITSYPNRLTYFFQVTAKDSSLNENIGTSELFSVYVQIFISRNPGFINGVIYIILVSFLIAGIVVYFNRKRAFLSPRAK